MVGYRSKFTQPSLHPWYAPSHRYTRAHIRRSILLGSESKAKIYVHRLSFYIFIRRKRVSCDSFHTYISPIFDRVRGTQP